MVKVHQETVDTYLANVSGLAIELTADKFARLSMDELAKQVDEAAIAAGLPDSSTSPEEICAGLVHNWLIPYVNAEHNKAEDQKRKRKLLFAVHQEIWASANQVVSEVSSGQNQQNSTEDSIPENEKDSRTNVETMTQKSD
ncbi:unnamed protein product [Protopolystoma xenopodis]|uniref:Uncharacterized protein n=1 Tax=Protopolystoma xenopodis TaxID=117903 RepID=A0A448XD12_9PLAT|nr:unnamed protein product [Protopolystoma xenopodis]